MKTSKTKNNDGARSAGVSGSAPSPLTQPAVSLLVKLRRLRATVAGGLRAWREYPDMEALEQTCTEIASTLRRLTQAQNARVIAALRRGDGIGTIARRERMHHRTVALIGDSFMSPNETEISCGGRESAPQQEKGN